MQRHANRLRFARHALRALDAVQLASALVNLQGRLAGRCTLHPSFLSADYRLLTPLAKSI